VALCLFPKIILLFPEIIINSCSAV
jgi:hypothetical protein